MEALQYIYTSWKNGNSTEKGYMIYSRSEGISESECTAIKDAMQYLAPKELTLTPTPQEIADMFPYAFSYFILPTGRGCVAQSTYLGKDYSGRFGNYIIYALVFDINALPCLPAELFGESYIKTAMTQEELDAPSPVPPLPALHISNYASVINDDQLNEFLFDKEDELAQLISMVLAAQDAGIPFYLNDSRENLVLWSAAVQRILPLRLATKFAFNTYIGDHESMRSPRVREEGLNFHLIGVRPDANYFNYTTESKSNRQIVMDFIGGNMTQGIAVSSYAQAMATSSALDYEEVDSFSEFVEGTTFNEINGHLLDAYLYYHLLKNDEFGFTENNMEAVLSFGVNYCSETDNSDVGSKLLIKYQEGGWLLKPELLTLFWKFVCSYSNFMIFTLYELFTETLYQHAGEASEPCMKLNTLIQSIKGETPQQYKEYLDYLNSANCVDQLLVYLSGHDNPFTNDFYITWLLHSYTFVSGISDGQPVSRLLKVLLKNVACIHGCEKQMIEILFTASDNQILFEDILSVFRDALNDPERLDLLCDKYVEATESLSEMQLNHFEQLLLETPRAVPIATRLCAKKIALSRNPKDEFWRFYDNQRSRIVANSGFAIDQMVFACLENIDAKNREEVAIEILHKIDASLINDSETIRALTDAINDCSVKTLSKMDHAFLQRVCQIRARIDKAGLDKIKAVFVGQLLVDRNAQRKRPVNLSDELSQANIFLQFFDKSDYESYIKSYFNEYLALVQEADDVSVLMQIFYHGRYFSNLADYYISALKKLEKKDNARWRRILNWTCIYLVTADRSNQPAEDLYKPVVRYLRTMDSAELMDIRHSIAKDVSLSLCDSLFEEVQRKEGIAEKLGGFFHKK